MSVIDPFSTYTQMKADLDDTMGALRANLDILRKAARQEREWRQRPMKYVSAWWEPKFAWMPTKVFGPPPEHDTLLWGTQSTVIWFKRYLRRKCKRNDGEVIWVNIRYGLEAATTG